MKADDAKMPHTPLLIDGHVHTDERGEIRFANEVSLAPVKRFYTIANKSTTLVRAWQGHKIEAKYLFAVNGSFLVAAVQLNDLKNPSPDLIAQRFVLKADTPQILFIPAGYANGVRALSDRNLLMVFSTLDLQESINDTYRYPKNLWCDWSL